MINLKNRIFVVCRWSLDMKKAAPRAGCSPFAIAISPYFSLQYLLVAPFSAVMKMVSPSKR